MSTHTVRAIQESDDADAKSGGQVVRIGNREKGLSKISGVSALPLFHGLALKTRRTGAVRMKDPTRPRRAGLVRIDVM